MWFLTRFAACIISCPTSARESNVVTMVKQQSLAIKPLETRQLSASHFSHVHRFSVEVHFFSLPNGKRETKMKSRNWELNGSRRCVSFTGFHYEFLSRSASPLTKQLTQSWKRNIKCSPRATGERKFDLFWAFRSGHLWQPLRVSFFLSAFECDAYLLFFFVNFVHAF